MDRIFGVPSKVILTLKNVQKYKISLQLRGFKDGGFSINGIALFCHNFMNEQQPENQNTEYFRGVVALKL
jgi:hypothetical protein